MPPLLPQDSDNILLKIAEPYYTNEDVAILHNIVVHAQELIPSLSERERLPTNALFHAYYSILPKLGIDADHDSRYARILFKIGGTRSDGSLYERFEAVLARMGIEIQFDQDIEGESEGVAARESYRKVSEPPLNNISSPEVVARRRGRNRGSSETPALEPRYNNGDTNPRRRASSSAFTAHSKDVVNRTSNSLDLSRGTSQLSTHNLVQTASQHGDQDEKDYGLRSWLNNDFDKQSEHPRTRSPSMHGSIRIKRSSSNAAQLDIQTASTSLLGPDDFFPEHTGWRGNTDLKLLKQPETFPPESEDFDDNKVTLMRKLQMENLTRHFLLKWHGQTLRLSWDNNNLETIAIHKDQRVLLRQAFDSWHVLIGERRQIAETERFFVHLEKRAGRARNLFLMAKALTHWAYSASSEIQRTSAARRHILRVRYFGAWRDTTAVTELKIRRQALRKLFTSWQRQYLILSINEEKAIVSFIGNLVQRMFWMWFWKFCGRRAPVWRSNRLLARQMAQWAKNTNDRRNEDGAVIEFNYQNTKKKTLSIWSNSAIKLIMQIRQANRYRNISSCRKALATWRHGYALLPRQQYLCRKLDSLTKHASINLWILRTRQESTARMINRLKIMKEAWVTWNHRLRFRSLQSKISDRLLQQGLYKCVLGERLVLLGRVMERRIVHSYLQKLSKALQLCAAKESRDLYLANQVFVRLLAGSAIRNWQSHLQNHLKHQRIAEGFNAPLLLTNLLVKWTMQDRRIAQLQKWAHDGKFYVLASKTIKSWKIATEQVKREKRRLAYTQYRRSRKIVLVRKLLLRWHWQANSITCSDHLAADAYQNKSVVSGMEAFDRWRARIEEVAEMNLMWERSLLQKHLNELRLSLVSRRDLELKVIGVAEERAGALCIKKWGRVHLQLRAMQLLVFELREKHLKKTCRRVLGHWLQRASHRKSRAGIQLEQSNLRSLDETESWAETGDEWADGANDNTFSASMLGYLSTPSRRMSRVKVVSRLPSTTPSAPLSTPSERQLRAQYSKGPLPSFRRRIGRSQLGIEGAQYDLGDRSGTGSQEEIID